MTRISLSIALRGSLVVAPLLGLPRPALAEDQIPSPDESQENGGTQETADAPSPSEPSPPSDETHAEMQPTPPAGVTPPELLSSVTPAYPEVPEGDRRPRDVVLRITITSDGLVSAAEILEGAGEPFDERAREAALAALFRPATRDGVPIAARVRYVVQLEPPAPEAPPARPAADGPAPVAVETPKAAEPIEVEVRGTVPETERLQKSAEAITVIRLEEAKKRSADMGEVLARTPGVVLRSGGGLGNDLRIALNGLYDNAVRTYVDGVPVWIAGYPENVAVLPVNLFHHIEIHNGVVPLRLSADALGGAINFVTDQTYETGASVAYQTGSFGTHRGVGLVQWRHEPTGFVARVHGFADTTDNSYAVDVEVPDDRGRLSPARVSRFHDGYSAYGVHVEAGFLGRPWARRLLLRGYNTSFSKELQHNLVMSVPYGEATYGDAAAGAQLRYEQDFSKDVNFELLTNYSRRTATFLDVSEHVYNWFGERVRERRVPGEIDSRPYDQTTWRNAGFARALVEWKLTPEHVLLASTSPTLVSQTGDERRQSNPDARDPLNARRNSFQLVSGLGYEWNALPNDDAPKNREERQRGTDYRFQNLLNVKSYFFALDSEEPLPGGLFRERRRDSLSFGLSEGFRLNLTKHLFTKVSYEFATRLPLPDEIFGNGVLVQANLELAPEVSHNANVGLFFEEKRTKTGDWHIGVLGTFRDADGMIVLLGNDRFFTYQNVYRAVAPGVNPTIQWEAPRRLASLSASLSYTPTFNNSDEGPFADFQGDRIPNRPDLNAAFGARLRAVEVFLPGDALEPFYESRFTGAFFRGWESQGLTQFKQRIEEQLAHTTGVSYLWSTEGTRFVATFEVQNLTDERLFDFFGVQRAGRTFFAKFLADFR